MALEKFVLFPDFFSADYPLNCFPLNINPQISQIAIKLFSSASYYKFYNRYHEQGKENFLIIITHELQNYSETFTTITNILKFPEVFNNNLPKPFNLISP